MDVYENPIIRGFNPDPSIVRVGSDFFLATSTFEYFPGLPIYHSKDLIKWELIGHALTRLSQLKLATPEPGGGIWAPTLRWHNGVFYILTSSFDRYRPQADDRVWPRGFCLQTANIWDSNSWSDPVFFDQVGFDQDILWDDDGTAYLSTTYRKLIRTPGVNIKDFAIHICTVDLDTGNSKSTPQLIRESSSGVAEGSHILKRGKYYYLFTAEGGTESGHSEWVSRSTQSPFGPWELGPRNPLWRNTVEDEVQNTGHADLVEDANGRWWGVFLGVRPTKTPTGWKASVFGRETFLVPITWEDDWPVFNGGSKTTLRSHGPGLYLLNHSASWQDDFSKPELELGWYRKNTPVKTDFSLTERPGYLRLHGGPYNLSSAACPTLFLRKQIALSGRWQCQLSFQPTSIHTEAGTAVYWNYFTYSSIGIRLSATDNGTAKRIIRYQPTDDTVQEVPLQTLDADVLLLIECGYEGYKFGFKELLEATEAAAASPLSTMTEVTWLGTVSNDAMTVDPPIGASFTGMMLGLYAFGELQRCLAPADFKFAQFE